MDKVMDWIVPCLIVVLVWLVVSFVFGASWAIADDIRISRAFIMGKPVFITNKECPLKEHSKTHPWLSYVVEVKTGLNLKGCWKFGTGIKTDLIIIQWDKGDFSELLANEFLGPNSQGYALPVKKLELKAEGDLL